MAKATRNEQTSGLLILLHGCSHSATDFWPAGEHCEDCIGLPVEKTIVAKTLSEGLAVVAMSSSNREHAGSPPKTWIGQYRLSRTCGSS